MPFINGFSYQVNYSKFYPPKSHPRYFSRVHLLEHLDATKSNKYTLLQAPEGYGKSALLSDWYHRVLLKENNSKKTLWFRVDTNDADPECFWCNLIEAMDSCWPGIKKASREGMDLLEQSSAPQLVLMLANHVVRYSDEKVQYLLIFDDFESFKLSESEGQFFLFADMLPANVNIIIASKEYLNNHLIGQDAYRQFSLLGASELAIAKEELSEMFSHSKHADISPELIDLIYLQTEGWPLALYTLLERCNAGATLEKALDELVGSDHFFGDPVFKRATQNLPQSNMLFLLETSFFEHFSEQLCNYVFENKKAQAIMQDLERRGTFIFATDSTRTRYRYHYLFAQWLRHHAMSMHRDQIRSINFKAAAWYHDNGHKLLSAKHTVIATEGNFVSGLSKVVFSHSPLDDQNLLPSLFNTREEALTRKPFFCLLAAWAYVFSGKPNEAQEWLQQTKALIASGQASVCGWSKDGTEDEEPQDDKELIERINLTAAVITSKCLILKGEAQLGIDHTESLLLEHGPFLDDRLKMVLYQSLGEAYEFLGASDTSSKYYQKAMTIAQVNGYDFLVSFTRYQIIRLAVEQGKLSEVETLCRTALANCPPDFTVYGALYSVLGWVQILRKKYEGLDTIFKRAISRISLNRNVDIYLDVSRARMRHLIINKQFSEALLQAAAARNVIINNKNNPARGTAPLIYAEQARLYLQLGDLESAKDTLKEFSSLNYPNTVEGILQQGIIQALIALEEGQVTETSVSDLSAHLCEAERGHYLLYQIEIYLLMTRLHYLLSSHGSAVSTLKKALELARKESIIHPFLISGESIRLLLAELVGTRNLNYESNKFARKIIASFDEVGAARDTETLGSDWVSNPSEKAPVSFVGHWGLTGREDEVLQLLVRGMNRKEIATEFCTSQNTIKTHISHIYEKMGVHSVSELLRKMVDSEAL